MVDTLNILKTILVMISFTVVIHSKIVNLPLKLPSSPEQLLLLPQLLLTPPLQLQQQQQQSAYKLIPLPNFKATFKRSFELLQQLQQQPPLKQPSASKAFIFQHNMCYACNFTNTNNTNNHTNKPTHNNTKKNSMTPDTPTPNNNTPDITTKETTHDKTVDNVDNDLSYYAILPHKNSFKNQDDIFCTNDDNNNNNNNNKNNNNNNNNNNTNNNNNNSNNNTRLAAIKSIDSEFSLQALLLSSLFGTFLISIILIALIYTCILMSNSRKKRTNYAENTNAGSAVKGNNKYNIFSNQLSNSTTVTQVSMCFDSPERFEIDDIIEEQQLVEEREEIDLQRSQETEEQIQEPLQREEQTSDDNSEQNESNPQDQLIISHQEQYQLGSLPQQSETEMDIEKSSQNNHYNNKIDTLEKPTKDQESLDSEQETEKTKQFQEEEKEVEESNQIQQDDKEDNKEKDTNTSETIEKPEKQGLVHEVISNKTPPPPPKTKPKIRQQQPKATPQQQPKATPQQQPKPTPQQQPKPTPQQQPKPTPQQQPKPTPQQQPKPTPQQQPKPTPQQQPPQQNPYLLKHLRSLKQQQNTVKHQQNPLPIQQQQYQLPIQKQKKQHQIQPNTFKFKLPQARTQAHIQPNIQTNKAVLTLKVSEFGDSVVD